jgi:hypothetical protein
MHCGENIADDDRGTAYPGAITTGPNGSAVFEPTPLYAHLECQLRSVLGCPGYVRGEHAPGEPCTDEDEMSYRDQARWVQAWVEAGGLR